MIGKVRVTSSFDPVMGWCVSTGRPLPEDEYRFAPPRRWRFDYAWPALLLALEVEGGGWKRGRHHRPAGYERDCEKYNAATLAGWRVLRVTTDMVKDGRVWPLLEEALGGTQ